MKKLILILCIIKPLFFYAQEIEWIVENSHSNPGERVIAIIDAASVGSYDGIGIVGQVIDNNGNWGDNTPTIANFTCHIKFSNGLGYEIKQDRETNNITLRLRKKSDSKVHLTANVPNSHRAVRVLYRIVELNGVTTMVGNPTIVNNTGELILNEPSYTSNFSGNVGIGTTTPDSKLTVDGKINSEEILVSIVAGADFVFEENYPLPALEDVALYIEENKHLPEIASAAEMQANGLELGEMNIKLLQKIEELTLYTINQEDRISKLENLIQQLIKDKE